MAADVLRPVYERTQGRDGYVSLEVAPDLAHDLERTLTSAYHLWSAVKCPNVMIKVPGDGPSMVDPRGDEPANSRHNIR